MLRLMVDGENEGVDDVLWCFGRCFDPVANQFSIGRHKKDGKLHGFGKQLDKPNKDKKDLSET